MEQMESRASIDLHIEVPISFHDVLFQENVTQVLALANLFHAHKFDLLGSGWRRVYYGMTALGVEGNVYPSGEAIIVDRDGDWLLGKIQSVNL